MSSYKNTPLPLKQVVPQVVALQVLIKMVIKAKKEEGSVRHKVQYIEYRATGNVA